MSSFDVEWFWKLIDNADRKAGCISRDATKNRFLYIFRVIQDG